MATPLAFNFRTQLQNVFESAEVELRGFGEASGMRHADVVVCGSDFRGEMILGGEQIDDLLLVGRVKKPALGFDAGGKKCDEQFAVILCPCPLGEETCGLIRPDELLDRAETHEAFALGYQRNRRAEHGAGKILL